MEQREYPRVAVAVAAELLLGEERIPCQTKNLSEGGVGVCLGRSLPERAQIVVNLFVTEDGIEDATSPSLNFEAQIVWTAEPTPGEWEAGLRFVATSPEQLALVRQFLSRAC